MAQYQPKLNDTILCKRWGTGQDSIKAITAFSLYHEDFKLGNYEDALPNWRYIFINAPGASKRPYVEGVVIMEHFIKKAKDPTIRQRYIDTLMLIYDQRIRCFGEEGFVLGRKGYHLYLYRKDSLREILHTFARSVTLQGNASEYFVIQLYFNAATEAFEKNLIPKEELLTTYARLMQIVDYNIAKGDANSPHYAGVKKELIAKSPIKDCSEAKATFQESYRQNPENEVLWQSIYDLLSNIEECQKDAFFLEVAKKLFDKTPQADIALKIARAEVERGQAAEAAKYFNHAIELETDSDRKAEYCYEAAGNVYYKLLNDFPKARAYAQRAINLRSQWGLPYIFIGDLYAASSKLCGDNGTGFESQVVVWPALDMYEKAKSIDPSVADVANRRINTYVQYLPSFEDGFLRELKEGDIYRVECWINETTRVRLRSTK